VQDVKIDPKGDEPNPDEEDVDELDEVVLSTSKSTLQ